MNGVCSPASHVRYLRKGDQMISKLGDFTINRFSSEEAAGYPTICKGRYRVKGRSCYPFEEPTSLNMAGYLGELAAAGVTALKIEGRQRGRAYVSQVVAAFREVRDALAEGKDVSPENLSALTEGQRETAGAYQKTWR
jgi:putative protease